MMQFADWDELVSWYENFLKEVLGISESEGGFLPTSGAPFKIWKHIEAMLQLIPEIREMPAFNSVHLYQWHTGLYLSPIPKHTSVGVWYEEHENSYNIFLTHPSHLTDWSWDDKQQVIQAEDIVSTLKEYLNRVRTDDNYQQNRRDYLRMIEIVIDCLTDVLTSYTYDGRGNLIR